MLLFLFSYAFPIAAAVSQTAQSVPSYGTISYDDAINPLLGGWGGVRLSEVNNYYSNMTFSDNFETGDFSKDSGYGGSIAVSNEWAAKGMYSAKVTVNGIYSEEAVYYNIGTNYSTVYEFWAFNVSAKTGTNNLILGGFLQTSDLSIVGYIGITGASNDLFLCYQDGWNTPQVTSATGISLNTDYTLEIMRTQSQTAGEYEVWLNGTQVNDLTVTGVNASKSASLPFLGNWYSATSSATYYVDCWNINPTFITADPYVVSAVFPNQLASDAEMAMIKLKNDGYNAIRAYWEASTSPSYLPDGKYDQTQMNKFIDIAKALNLWVVGCCMCFFDQYEYETQWLNDWKNIIGNTSSRYDKIIWEPCNEPLMQYSDGSHALTGQTAIDGLRDIYNSWINMDRGLGDNHWIVVSEVCWMNGGFPNVTDPLNRIFLNMHLYYNYQQFSSKWTISQAQTFADSQYGVITSAMSTFNRPFLCTEMGAHWVAGSPPDVQYDGASGYTTVSLAFVQRLITDFDNYNGRIGYMLWPAGDWAKDWSEGWHYCGLYGGMDVWEQLLASELFNSS